MRLLGCIGGVLAFLGLIWGIFLLNLGLTCMVIGGILMLVSYWFIFDEV